MGRRGFRQRSKAQAKFGPRGSGGSSAVAPSLTKLETKSTQIATATCTSGILAPTPASVLWCHAAIQTGPAANFVFGGTLGGTWTKVLDETTAGSLTQLWYCTDYGASGTISVHNPANDTSDVSCAWFVTVGIDRVNPVVQSKKALVTNGAVADLSTSPDLTNLPVSGGGPAMSLRSSSFSAAWDDVMDTAGYTEKWDERVSNQGRNMGCWFNPAATVRTMHHTVPLFKQDHSYFAVELLAGS